MDEEPEINPAFAKPKNQRLTRGALLLEPDTLAEILLNEIAKTYTFLNMSSVEHKTLDEIFLHGILTAEDAAFVHTLHAKHNIAAHYWR